MVAAFPLAKIGILLMKQLSKPLANLIKNEAKKHPSIRKHVIIPMGKAYRWAEVQALHRIMGTKPKELGPLTEEESVELGANAIGEIIFFGLLSGVLFAEYQRMGEKKEVIQRIKEDEISNVVTTLLDVIEEVTDLKKSVKKIENDLEAAFNVVELEEERHIPVQDHNFLDVMVGNKRKFGKLGSKETLWDTSSPSV